MITLIFSENITLDMCFNKSTRRDKINKELQEVSDNTSNDDVEDQEFIEEIQADLDDQFWKLINEILEEGHRPPLTLEIWKNIDKEAFDKILDFCEDVLDTD